MIPERSSHGGGRKRSKQRFSNKLNKIRKKCQDALALDNYDFMETDTGLKELGWSLPHGFLEHLQVTHHQETEKE